MKKITALGIGTLLGLSAIAAPAVSEKITRTDAVKLAHEAKGKKVKGLPAVRNKEQKRSGLTIVRNLKRLAVNANPKRQKSPAKISAENNSLYGFLAYYEAEDYSQLGYCRINPETGTYENVVPCDLTGTAVGQKDGKLYMNAYESFWGYIMGAYNLVYDLETGELLEADEIDLDSNINQLFSSAGFDAENGIFYGVTFSDTEDRPFTTYNVETKQYTYYAPTTLCSAITYNQETGEVVGIETVEDGNTNLISYDPTSGEASVMASVNYFTDYPGGLCYSPEDGGYLWNPNSDDWSKLVLISPAGEVTELCDLDGYAEFTVLVNTELKKVDANAPGKPSIDSVEFEGPSLTGKVTVTLPEVTEGGKELTGSVNYTLYANDEAVSEGSAAAGSTLTLDVTVAEGMNTFSLECTVNDLTGRAATIRQYVGNDVPCAPEFVLLTSSTVSWDAVADGVHGGYLDAAAVTYTVSLNGVQIAKDITETSCATGLPANTNLDLYVAEVVASCNGLTSEPGVSNDLVYGDPLTLPVSLEPTEKESKLFTILDSNADGSSWNYYTGGEFPVFRYEYSDDDADDWLILPPVSITDVNALHSFSMVAFAQQASYPERYEVFIGKSPRATAMTQQIAGPTVVDYSAPTPAEYYFNVKEAGTYYIGIHAISDGDAYYLNTANYAVDNTGILSSGAAAATAIEAVAAPKGALSATVTAKLPTKTIAGSNLAADTKVKLTVTSAAATAFVEGAPGETVSVDVMTEQGTNRLRVQTSTSEGPGMIEFVNVFTGSDVPGELTNFSAEASADNLSAKITWEAPTIGADGGYVAPTGITYYTCVNTIFGWSIDEEIGTDVYEVEISVPAGSPQANQTVAIIAANDYGYGVISAISVPLGELYEMPAKETFPDATLTYSPVTIYNGGVQMSWNLGDPGEMFGINYINDSGVACVGWADVATTGMISFPRFNATGANNLTLDFSLYCGDIADVILNATGYGVEDQTIFRLSDVNHGTGYQNFSIQLPEAFQNIPWVSFEFETVLGEGGGHFILENYNLRNVVDNDLAVISVEAQKSASIGETIDVIASVENQGLNPMEFKGGEFTLTAPNGKVVATKSVTASKNLNSGTVAQANAQFELTTECVGVSTITFTLAGNDDAAQNNKRSVNINVTRGAAVVVTDLEGEWNSNGSSIDLSWSPAEYNPGFASFENETPFVISSDKIGEFVNVDRDGKDVYSWQGANSIPELDNIAFKAGAFNVINANALDSYFSDDLTAADGEQCLIAFCPADGSASDDWLISPELVAGTSFSFMAKPLTLQYGPEVLEICYSTGSINPADFKVLESIEVDEDGWSEFELKLPAEATRFAIHYTSVDIFGVMIDAIRYTPKDASELTGYDVYRFEDGKDAVKLAHVTDCKYADTDVVSTGSYNYYVIPTLANGAEGEKSNVVAVYPLGVDNVKATRSILSGRGEVIVNGFAGEKLNVSNAAGQSFIFEAASDNESISVPAGVYVVKSGKTVVKVLVK